MTEKPRTWLADVPEDGIGLLAGALYGPGTKPRNDAFLVIELEPVLDIIERAVLGSIFRRDLEALLREHGRLK